MNNKEIKDFIKVYFDKDIKVKYTKNEEGGYVYFKLFYSPTPTPTPIFKGDIVVIYSDIVSFNIMIDNKNIINKSVKGFR